MTQALFPQRPTWMLGSLLLSLSAAAPADPLNFTHTLSKGWNLIGNSLDSALDVRNLYSDAARFQTVWKWDAGSSKWLFYAPSLDNGSALADYAASHGYGLFDNIAPGEGYWVNTVADAATVGPLSGNPHALSADKLIKGWNLVATGQNHTAPAFNRSLSGATSGSPENLTSLWGWDTSSGKWYFYAPKLEATNGLAAYQQGKGYLDFGEQDLSNGRGFWVNYPGPQNKPAGPYACGFETGNPILFTTSPPIPGDFGTRVASFGNHVGTATRSPRGGDLYIRYPDGSLRNLTKEAGWGIPLANGDEDPVNSIAVRDPSPHWSGNKALFSMAVGSGKGVWQSATAYWQIYEVSGFCPGETVKITKLAQPGNYNHVQPFYGSDEGVMMVSDMPPQGPSDQYRHLYPLQDEYEGNPINSGIWKLNRSTGDVHILNHSPSGVFDPTLDSFGRIVFVRWDHMKRDAKKYKPDSVYCESARDNSVGVDFQHEGANAPTACPGVFFRELFPEIQPSVLSTYIEHGKMSYTDPLGAWDPSDFLNGIFDSGHYRYGNNDFNQFIPWMLMQDGTDEETLNHVGRHEIGGTYTTPTRPEDPSLSYWTTRFSKNETTAQANNGQYGFHHMREDPTRPGRFYFILSDEFNHKTSGQILYLDGAPKVNPADMSSTFVTHPATRTALNVGQTAPAGHSGLYRQPLPLSDGSLLAVHTPPTVRSSDSAVDLASSNNRTLASSFKFRLRSLKTGGDGYMAADGYLTPGFSKTVSYWTGDSQPIQYSGELWELDPVEVRIRAVPPQTAAQVDPVEAAQIAAAGVDVAELQQWLKARNLALLVVRNATQRDSSDAQQPFNLRVPGGVTGLAPDCDPDKGCKVWDVDHLQVFEARYVRGRDYEFKGQSNFVPSNGRRVLPRPLTEFGPVSSVDAKVVNPPAKDGTPKGSVALESDGSIAAFIPARRALTWQLIDSTHPGNPAKGSDGIVRERYWLTYQPGEIRTCPTCHGVNKTDQKGLTATTQPGAALSKLLQHWKDNYKP